MNAISFPVYHWRILSSSLPLVSVVMGSEYQCALIHNASHKDMIVVQNKAYMRLFTENFRLMGSLQTLEKVYNSLASGVNRLSPDVSVVAIEDTLPLNVENYPTIKFWYKRQRHKETTRRRKLAQPNSRRDSQDKNIYFWFLQNVDGMVVDSDVVTSLRAEAKVIWTGMCDEYGPMGLPWSSVPAKRRLEFWLKLERVDYTHWYKARFSPTRALHSSSWKCGCVTKPVRVRKS